MRIHEVLASKPTQDVVTVKPDATVRELIGVLAEHNIGALVVSVDGASVDGIVSERDVVRRLHEDEARARVARSPRSCPRDVQTCERRRHRQRADAGDDRAALPARPGRRRGRPADSAS